MTLRVSEMNGVLPTRDSLHGGGSQDMNRRVGRKLARVRARDNAVPSLPEGLKLRVVIQLGAGGVVGRCLK